VQATVRTFEAESRCGSVLLADGTEIPFDGAAFDAGGLRFLRFGQRVRIRTVGDGSARRVVFLTIPPLPRRPAELD
jgi:2-phospho-L-lactate guanylyltransferase